MISARYSTWSFNVYCVDCVDVYTCVFRFAAWLRGIRLYNGSLTLHRNRARRVLTGSELTSGIDGQ